MHNERGWLLLYDETEGNVQFVGYGARRPRLMQEPEVDPMIPCGYGEVTPVNRMSHTTTLPIGVVFPALETPLRRG